MKTPSTDLFLLIKSLSPQEKKYFKQYAQQYSAGRNNTYVLLFDAIAAQEAYNEDLLKKKFAKHDFIKQLPVAKNYLFEKILDCMMEMHTQTDEGLLIQRMTGRFEFLFRRNLISSALSFYNKAESKAIENDNITLLPHITRQKNLMLTRSSAKFKEGEWIDNAEKAVQHTRVLLNFLEYELLASKVSVIFTNPQFGYDKKLSDELEHIMSHELFESEEKALSFKAWHYFSKTKYRYLHVAGKRMECMQFIKNCNAYLEKHYAENTTWQVVYFRTQSDFMNICLSEKQFDACLNIFSNFEKMMAEKYYPLPIIRQAYFSYKLLYHASSGLEIDAAIQYWQSNQAYWHEIKDKIEIPVRHNIVYDVFRIYFRKQDWKNAILTFNELIDHKTLNVFEAPARIYWLMLQYEIANIALLPNLTANARDWFKRNKMLNPTEKISLQFFEQLPKARNKKEAAELFKKFGQALASQPDGTADQDASVKSDLLDWIGAKVQGKRF